MKDAGYELAVFAGDGTGPEVIREGVKILNVLAEGGPAPWRATEYPGGGQYFLKTGREWEPEGEAAAHRADAILLGAVGWPGATLPNGDIAAGHSSSASGSPSTCSRTSDRVASTRE